VEGPDWPSDRGAADVYRSVFEHAPVGLSILRLERDDDPSSFRIVMVNEATRRLVRLPMERIRGRLLTEVTPGVLDTDRPRQYLEVVRTRTAIDLGDMQHPQAPDRIVRVHAFPIPERCVGVLMFDVSEHRRIEHDLGDALARVELVNRAVNDVVYDWWLQAGVVEWSGAFEHLFGYRVDDAVRRVEWWLDRLHPDDRTSVERQLHELLEGGGHSWTGEYRFRRADGTWSWVFDRALVVRDAGGAAVRVTGAMTDVTERRALEEQLRHSQRMEAIGRLAGGVAHDFNNLLTAMLGYADMLAEDVAGRPAATAWVGEIRKAVESAAGVTRQLLALSRRQVLQPQTLDVNEIVARLTGLLRRVIGEHIELDVRLAPDPAHVRADSSQIEQVLVNLTVNARDAMPHGGRLEVSVGRTVIATVPPRGWPKPGSYAVISVADTGTGIDEAALPHVFEPFFTTKPGGQGVGLGLATVYGVVKQSGGWIDVETVPQDGTTFTIYLPETRDPVDAPAAGAREVRAHVPARVLVVEDDASVRDLVRLTLERQGYTVVVAETGEAALAGVTADEAPLDLLLTDVVLPGMTGDVLDARLRQLRPGTRTLFMTGYVNDEVVKAGRLASGDILMKPFTASTLLARVSEMLTR
jgi:PAS domain S-box-containing protein